jgi:(2R)-sulfolactate sulfo-lyase subunit alpha
MSFKFVAHAKEDHVGVAVEDIRAGEMVEGFVLEDGQILAVNAIQDIPLGHKISLAVLDEGATVKKYGEAIGKAGVKIVAGEHVHVHNLKSARPS